MEIVKKYLQFLNLFYKIIVYTLSVGMGECDLLRHVTKSGAKNTEKIKIIRKNHLNHFLFAAPILLDNEQEMGGYI